jgi:carboxylate-amine ligase
LSASSPILDGKDTGFLDARMEAYLHHQERLPQLMGSLIPEAVFSQEEYYREIFSPIAKAMQPFDTEHVMDHHFANSRGAIARFDRGAIEIRVIDIQECPSADLAIAELIVAVLKAMANARWVSSYLQRAWDEADLLPLFQQVIKDAGDASITNRDYLLMFGLMKQDEMSAGKLWQHLFVEVYGDLSEGCREHISFILEHGCLAKRILARTGPQPSHEVLCSVYRELADCLDKDRPFR